MAMMRMLITISTGIQGVDHPTALPSVKAKSRIRRPIVIIAPPVQSTLVLTLRR